MIGAYCLSEAGSGSDAFALATRAAETGRRLRHQRPQAVDHQRQRSGHVHRVRERQSRCRLPRHHRVHRRSRHAGIHGRQEGRQARHPRQQHVRADLRRLRRAEVADPRRGRQGLQGRDRNAQRRPHRHRRADARPRAGRARSHGQVHQGAQAVRQADRRLPGRAVPDRAHGDSTSKRRGCWSTTARACATPACRS